MNHPLAAFRRARGSALVSVILVILILTIVGVGIAYFSQVEDRLSSNTRLTRMALYAADAGLRKGEMILGGLNASAIPLGTILNYTGATPVLNVPGGGPNAVIIMAQDPEDLVTKEFLNLVVPSPDATVDPYRTRFSLYVRNNPEDVLGSATVDTDQIINLISVGMVAAAPDVPPTDGTYETKLASTPAILTKIVEEQLVIGQIGSALPTQPDGVPTGQNTGAKRG